MRWDDWLFIGIGVAALIWVIVFLIKLNRDQKD